MRSYELIFLVDPTSLTEGMIDALYARHDCLVATTTHGRAFVTITEAAPTFDAALQAGWGHLTEVGLVVTGLERDLVTAAEIADRIGTTSHAVHNWIRGESRDRLPFPAPFTGQAKPLWLWHDVQQWALDSGIPVKDADMSYPSARQHDDASARIAGGSVVGRRGDDVDMIDPTSETVQAPKAADRRESVSGYPAGLLN